MKNINKYPIPYVMKEVSSGMLLLTRFSLWYCGKGKAAEAEPEQSG